MCALLTGSKLIGELGGSARKAELGLKGLEMTLIRAQLHS